MSKLVLSDVTNITGAETSAIATINQNSADIETALENTLSRDGTSPNQMNADLDLNTYDLLNVGSVQTESIILGGTEVFIDDITAVGPQGPAGPTGPQGPAGAGSGDMIRANNLSDVISASTSFTNIKQAATTSATGVVELATDAETQTGTDTTRAITPANLTAKEATISDWRANVADRLLTTDIVNSAMAEVTLTDAATIAWDMSTGIDFVVTLGGNRTLGNPTNTIVGRRGRIRVVQDGTGSRTLTKSSNHKTAGGTTLGLSSVAASVDYIDYDVVSATNIRLSVSKAWA